MDWNLLIPIIAGGIRNISGWAEASLKDGKIDKYEWSKLFGTIIEVGVISFSLMYGLGLDATSASGLGILGSFLLSGLKKMGTA